jgi:hypothetical protein
VNESVNENMVWSFIIFDDRGLFFTEKVYQLIAIMDFTVFVSTPSGLLALGIFWGQESSWWLQNGAPKEKLYLWIVSNWKLKLCREQLI